MNIKSLTIPYPHSKDIKNEANDDYIEITKHF